MDLAVGLERGDLTLCFGVGAELRDVRRRLHTPGQDLRTAVVAYDGDVLRGVAPVVAGGWFLTLGAERVHPADRGWWLGGGGRRRGRGSSSGSSRRGRGRGREACGGDDRDTRDCQQHRRPAPDTGSLEMHLLSPPRR